MSRKSVDLIWFSVSVFFVFVLSLSFLLMPLESATPAESISLSTLIAGLMFWISVIMIIITQFVLARRRKKWYVINRVRKSKLLEKTGIISFFKNIYAIVADVVAVISLISTAIAMLVTQGSGYICYVFVSLFVFSFSMHCILNGKVFYHVVNQNNLLQAIEKERANSSK